jgi:hypothetical protein
MSDAFFTADRNKSAGALFDSTEAGRANKPTNRQVPVPEQDSGFPQSQNG